MSCKKCCTKMKICDYYFPETKCCATCEDEDNSKVNRPCEKCGSDYKKWRPKTLKKY